MGKVVNFINNSLSAKELEEQIEYYRSYIDEEGILVGHNRYYLIKHAPLEVDENFANIICPECGNPVNEYTLDGERVIAHGAIDDFESDINEDRSAWALAELLCPSCKEKLVIIFE